LVESVLFQLESAGTFWIVVKPPVDVVSPAAASFEKTFLASEKSPSVTVGVMSSPK